LVQSFTDPITTLKVFGQLHVGGVVTRLTLEKPPVKVCQLSVARAQMFGEQPESFTTSCLNQRGNQQAVDRPLGFAPANERVESATVGAGRQTAEGDSPSVQ
jgi:hypothetical protein